MRPELILLAAIVLTVAAADAILVDLAGRLAPYWP